MGKTFRLISILAISTVTIVSFQNCSNGNFTTNEDSLAFSSQSVFSSNDGITYASTKKNTPVIFKLDTSRSVGYASFDGASSVLSATTEHGKFEVVNAAAFQIRYTPNNGFNGTDTLSVFVRDGYGSFARGGIEVSVGNVIGKIQPALAVRGISCVACHANVKSNIVTDMGYGGDGAGREYFFNTSVWNWNSGFYGDHGGTALETLQVGTGAQVLVPKAAFPAALAASTGASSLENYFDKAFARSPYAVTRSAAVVPMNKVKISLPTAARLRQLFGNPGTASVYEKESDASPALAGLNYNSGTKVFTVSDLTCDGDLFLEGTLMMTAAKIRSRTGCRIYVTGSVFVQEGFSMISTQAGLDQANLQIVSATSVWMGTGTILKNSMNCDPNGHMTVNRPDLTDTMTHRMNHMVAYKAFTRSAPDLTAFRAVIEAEASKVGPRFDATCTPAGRTVHFSRLLIAAPWVNSRYNGNFSGSIVSETALMALGAFKFEFDPIFKYVSVLPKLDPDELLAVQ